MERWQTTPGQYFFVPEGTSNSYTAQMSHFQGIGTDDVTVVAVPKTNSWALSQSLSAQHLCQQQHQLSGYVDWTTPVTTAIATGPVRGFYTLPTSLCSPHATPPDTPSFLEDSSTPAVNFVLAPTDSSNDANIDEDWLRRDREAVNFVRSLYRGPAFPVLQSAPQSMLTRRSDGTWNHSSAILSTNFDYVNAVVDATNLRPPSQFHASQMNSTLQSPSPISDIECSKSFPNYPLNVQSAFESVVYNSTQLIPAQTTPILVSGTESTSRNVTHRWPPLVTTSSGSSPLQQRLPTGGHVTTTPSSNGGNLSLNRGRKQRTHTCATCGRSFKYATAWKRHLVTHTGDKPFVCSECGQAFGLKHNLTRHVRYKHSLSCMLPA